MKKDDNSGVSIKQIIVMALFLMVTTFGGLNFYSIEYEKNTDTIHTIESASAERFESALVENTEEDLIYSKRIEYLGAKNVSEDSELVISRGNYIRNQDVKEPNIINEEDNKLLNAVLNGIKELEEIHGTMVKNSESLENEVIISGDNKLVEEKSNEISQEPENSVEEQVKEEVVVTEVIGVPTEYIKTIDVKATAYCLCKKCCGKSSSHPAYGVTASGLKIIPGTNMKVVASDPSVIPLGTEVYIEGLYGAKDYGYAIVADTGSAIKNLKIDLYMDTHQMALNWGVKTVRVYILDK